MDVGL